MASENAMAFVGWKDSYFTGVAEIDLQHQELLVLLNKLYDAMARRDVFSVQKEVMMRLVRYTESHFGAEERLMEKVGYPELEAHRLEHLYLRGQVETAVRRIDAGETIITIGLLRFIKDWLINHIGQSDAQIGKHIRGRCAA